MKGTDRIYLLMGKELSHAITPAEAEELKALLAADPELWYAYELIQAAHSMDDVTQEYVQEIRSLLDGRMAPEKLHALLPPVPAGTVQEMPAAPRSGYRRLFRVAAALGGIIVMTLASLALFRQTVKQKAADVAMNKVVAPRGTKTHIVLADGTAIWLNAGSELTYPKHFSLENRVVHLEGEAYFKVPHDEAHPFTVHTREATITDLGTTFNVKAYRDATITEATLIEGVIEVSLEKDPDKKIRMSPGEKLVLHNKPAGTPGVQDQPVQVFEVSRIMPYSKTNDVVETAWLENKLIFRNERFADLAVMMERRYNISILIRDEEVGNYQVTGIFEHENIEEALKLLQAIVPFKFKIMDRQVIINR